MTILKPLNLSKKDENGKLNQKWFIVFYRNYEAEGKSKSA